MGHVELWDIRQDKILKSKELSSKPIVYGSRIFNEENNILLGLENWKGVLLNHKLEILEEKILRNEGHDGVVKSLEHGADQCFFGLKNGQIEVVGTTSANSDSVYKILILIIYRSHLILAKLKVTSKHIRSR